MGRVQTCRLYVVSLQATSSQNSEGTVWSTEPQGGVHKADKDGSEIIIKLQSRLESTHYHLGKLRCPIAVHTLVQWNLSITVTLGGPQKVAVIREVTC